MPKKGSSSPVIVYIHGSGWEFGDKSKVQKKPEYFTSKGYIFISINYRLSPAVKYSAPVQDVADAIVWIYNNIKHYSGDKNNIFLIGYASGADLAALVSTDDQYLKNAKGSASLIKATVLLDGIAYDIPELMFYTKEKQRDQYTQSFGSSKKEWQLASPVTYINPENTYPPFLVMHTGEGDDSEMEAKILAKKLKDADAEFQLINYPKENQASLNRSIGKEGDKATIDILRFLLKITAPYHPVN